MPHDAAALWTCASARAKAFALVGVIALGVFAAMLIAAGKDRLGFPRPNFEARAATLSGGNLQRVVLTRELAHEPKLIVALYPTRGLDARSTAAVRALLRDVRDRGAAVLMVSEDLDELFEVSDRLIVMFRGAVAAEFGPEDFRAEAVGPLMVGMTEQSDAA